MKDFMDSLRQFLWFKFGIILPYWGRPKGRRMDDDELERLDQD